MYHPLALALLLLSPSLLQSTTSADDRLELLSYFDAYQANWEGIKSLDTLCRTEVSVDPGVTPATFEVTNERLIADFDNHRFLYCKSTEQPAATEDEPPTSQHTGFIIQDNLVWRFQSDGWSPPETIADFKTVFDEFRVPDWRLVALMHGGRGESQPWSRRNTELLHASPLQSESVHDMRLRGERIGYESFHANGAGARYVFQADTLMPTEVTWLNKDESRREKGMDVVLVLGRDQLQWTLSGAHYVPTQIMGNYIDRQFIGDVERLRTLDIAALTKAEIEALYTDVNLSRDLRFRWFSINQPFKPWVFDLQTYNDPVDFANLCSPDLLP